MSLGNMLTHTRARTHTHIHTSNPLTYPPPPHPHTYNHAHTVSSSPIFHRPGWPGARMINEGACARSGRLSEGTRSELLMPVEVPLLFASSWASPDSCTERVSMKGRAGAPRASYTGILNRGEQGCKVSMRNKWNEWVHMQGRAGALRAMNTGILCAVDREASKRLRSSRKE
eukprot:scaffold101493_cov19-Tisochrysis_lutea.AAC.1